MAAGPPPQIRGGAPACAAAAVQGGGRAAFPFAAVKEGEEEIAVKLLKAEAVSPGRGSGRFQESSGQPPLSLHDQDLPATEAGIDTSPRIAGLDKDRLGRGEDLPGPLQLPGDLVEGFLSPQRIRVAPPAPEIRVEPSSLGEVGEGRP